MKMNGKSQNKIKNTKLLKITKCFLRRIWVFLLAFG